MQFFNRASEALVSPSFDPSAQTQSAEQPTGSLFLRDLPRDNSCSDTSPASRAPAAAGSERGLLCNVDARDFSGKLNINFKSRWSSGRWLTTPALPNDFPVAMA